MLLHLMSFRAGVVGAECQLGHPVTHTVQARVDNVCVWLVCCSPPQNVKIQLCKGIREKASRVQRNPDQKLMCFGYHRE
jgi:hypothetical protein